MSFWPESLVREVARQRVIFFVGAGASAGAIAEDGTTNPPDWKSLLRTAAAQMPITTDDRDYALSCISSKHYLQAAEVIFASGVRAEYSEYLRQVFVAPKFKPTRIHEIVRDMDPRVVVTTNYDRLFEVAQPNIDAYTVRSYHDDNLLDAVRSGEPVIIKAHGCVSHPDKTVLTRTSYHDARRAYPFFYAVLDSLFMLHTVVFVGASLTDPDIQLVLENVNLAAKCAYPHYALMAAGQHGAWKDATGRAYNIRVLEYDYDPGVRDHSDCVVKLDALKADVDAYRQSYVSGP